MKKRILLIEDDAALRMLYEDELGEEGYEVLSARDGKEGLRRYEQERPDLVVLDIVMPVMDGIETLNAILGKDRRVPVILNTAYAQYKENFMTWGAEAYVIKSSDLTELKEKIRDVLSQRKKGSSEEKKRLIVK